MIKRAIYLQIEFDPKKFQKFPTQKFLSELSGRALIGSFFNKNSTDIFSILWFKTRVLIPSDGRRSFLFRLSERGKGFAFSQGFQKAENDSQRLNWNADETRTRETLPASNTGLYRVNW